MKQLYLVKNKKDLHVMTEVNYRRAIFGTSFSLIVGIFFPDFVQAIPNNAVENNHFILTKDRVDPVLAQVKFDSSFLSGEAKRIDLSSFEKGNLIQAGIHQIDVYLNGAWQGRHKLQFKKNKQGRVDACISLILLEEMGVDSQVVLEKSSPSPLPSGQDCTPLNQRISNAFGSYDSGNLRYDISIPQVFMRREARGYVSPSLWDRGINAGFIGYSFNSNFNNSSVLGEQNRESAFLGLNTGFNLNGWQFRHDSNLTWSNTSSEGVHWQGIATYVQRGLPDLGSVLTIGEAYSDGELYDSINYRGVNLASDDRMQPNSQRGYAPVVRGIAKTNARVEIRQNDKLIYSSTVSPGNFIIDDLYPTGYGGDLEVSVIEVDGQRSEFKVPFNSVPHMLREGLSRYALTAGQIRGMQLSNKPWFMRGTYKRGIGNQLTLFGGGTMSDSYMSILFGSGLSTPIGAFSIDITHARTKFKHNGDYSGNSLRLSYSKILENTDTNLSLSAYRYSTEGFYSLSDAVKRLDFESRGSKLLGQGRQRSQFQLTLNQPLGERLGNLYISGSSKDFYDREGTSKQYQLGYNNSWGSVNVGFSLMRTDGFGYSDNQYMLSLSIPLGSGSNPLSMNMDLGATEHGGYDNARVSIAGAAGDDNNISYGISLSDSRSGEASLAGNIDYRSRFTALSAAYSHTSDVRQASFGANGSVLLHSGGVTFSPERGNTMVLIEAPGAENAIVSNSAGVRIDSEGYAVVPYVTPYRLSTISLDPQGMAHDIELESTSQQIAPFAGAIGHLRFKTRKGYSLLIKVSTASDYSLPFGAEVKEEQGHSVGMVGQGQRIYVRTEREQGKLLVQWGERAEQSCYIDYEIPLGADASETGFIMLEKLCQ
ncbi:fimbria/pilus outer membrane usher protein [Pseudoalteromonas lipolytica]|uniref:Fimbrial biogenesis outer membrane usher protein n=1 Tax=Pseudoalteromonas lipolytica TaxID=570156 RepID=A0ABU8SZ22_9GAMM